MLFISLHKMKGKPTKENIAKADKLFDKIAKLGVNYIGRYWTLGRYDVVLIFEAPDEKTAMKAQMLAADFVTSETLVAVPRAEAIKLAE